MMGQYCRTITRERTSNYLSGWCTEDDMGLNQSYDSFAVLCGIRNYNDIKPLFPRRDYRETLKKTQDKDRDPWSDPRDDWDLLRGYYPTTYFTMEEWDALDLDRPLEFIPDGEPLPEHLKHRAESLREGDTYRSFIERETRIFQWIEYLKANDIVFVALAFD